MNALLKFAPLLARQNIRLIRTIALSLVTLAAGVALLGVSGWFLTAAAISTAGAAFNIFGPSALVRGLSLIRILSRYGEKLAGHDATLRLLSDIRRWLFAALFPILPLSDRRLGRADLVSRLVADVEALDVAFLVFLGPIATAVLMGLAVSLGLLGILPGASLFYAACFFSAVLLVPFGLILVSRRAGTRAIVASSTLRGAVLDGIDCHRDLVAFGAVGRARDTVARAAVELERPRRTLGLAGAIASGMVQLLGGGAVLAILAAGLPALTAGRIDGPLLLGVLLAVIASFEASTPLVRGATRLAAAAAAAERLKSLAEMPAGILPPAEAKVVPAGGHLEFDRVSFGYDPRRPILPGLSFQINSGECVALVGPSGAGKSTIAQLAARLLDPQEGVVRLCGVDLRAIALTELRSRIGMMTQDAPIFLDTLRNNLLIGRPDASDADLLQGLSRVRLDSFVAALPEGLDTILGEAGQSLSTGQARRICLARTLLSQASVIIVDEPTSGLDAETEAELFVDLPRIMAGRTLFVVTHAQLPDEGNYRVLRMGAAAPT